MGQKKKQKQKTDWRHLPLAQDAVAQDGNADSLRSIPEALRLELGCGPGLFFGIVNLSGKHPRYIGLRSGEDGNVLVSGTIGSGKTTGVIIPSLILQTLEGGTFAALDVKGDICAACKTVLNSLPVEKRISHGITVIDPMDFEGPSFDPFDLLENSDSIDQLHLIMEISQAMFPAVPGDTQPFWIDTERCVFAAAMLQYFLLGLSFSEAICKIADSDVSQLCDELCGSSDARVRMLIGQTGEMRKETVASIDRGIRTNIVPLAADRYLNHLFRGRREAENCISWDDLDRSPIIIRVPPERLDQWAPAINLMLSQLIRSLERRPDKHTPEAASVPQTFVVIDEFPRLGKLEPIFSALSTLRSRKVNFLLAIQNLSQLDEIYGECGRERICGDCEYKILLRASDSKTQRYFADLIGTRLVWRNSYGEQYDTYKEAIVGISRQTGQVREDVIQPSDLVRLDQHAVLLSRYGAMLINKLSPQDNFCEQVLDVVKSRQRKHNKQSEGLYASIDDPVTLNFPWERRNEGAQTLRIEERLKNANRRIALRSASGSDNRSANPDSNFALIGKTFCGYFPEFRISENAPTDERRDALKKVEDFLAGLINRGGVG